MRLLDTLPAFLIVLLLAAGCEPADETEPMADDRPGEAMGNSGDWISLASLDAWRGFKHDSLPPGWTMDDGALYFTGDGDASDIITKEAFDDFELELEWKISEAGNSGIMYRVDEDHDYPWETGPEMQVLDDERHPDRNNGEDRHAGANYDMHAPSVKAVNPAGEWNQVRLVVDSAHVEHWMNGQKIVEYELWDEEWEEAVAESKWVDYPDYGRNRAGHIVLQDHDDPVWFRNIRIRRLGDAM